MPFFYTRRFIRRILCEKKEFLRNACKQFLFVLVESWKRWVRMKLYPSLVCISNFTLIQTFVVYFGVDGQNEKRKRISDKCQFVQRWCYKSRLWPACTTFTLLNPRWREYINIPYDLKVQRPIVHLYSELSNIQGNVSTMYRQQ